MSRGPVEFSGGFEASGRFNASCRSAYRIRPISRGLPESRAVSECVRLRRRRSREPADTVSAQGRWRLGTHREVQSERGGAGEFFRLRNSKWQEYKFGIANKPGRVAASFSLPTALESLKFLERARPVRSQ